MVTRSSGTQMGALSPNTNSLATAALVTAVAAAAKVARRSRCSPTAFRSAATQPSLSAGARARKVQLRTGETTEKSAGYSSALCGSSILRLESGML